MSSSTIVVPILVTSGAGALVIGVVDLARWQAFESKHPTVGATLASEGYLWNPVSEPKSDRMRVSKDAKMVDLTNWNCFQRMFPGIDINQTETTETNAITYTDPQTSSSSGESEKVVGCAIMDLQPVAQANKNKKAHRSYYHFKTELVVKGENSAIAIWTALTNRPTGEGIKSEGDDNSDRFKFVWRVVSLSKSDSTWKIEAGYQWDNYSSQKGGFYIKPPEEKDYWFYGTKFKDTEYVYPRRWMGVWEVSEHEDENTSGLFSGIQVYRYHVKQAEVLGKGNGENLESLQNQVDDSSHKFGYSSVNTSYDTAGDKGWVKYSGTGADISKWLEAKYAPFDKWQGKWTELYTRCNSLYWSRDLEAESVKNMRVFCYDDSKKN